jgi:hydrogenase maturation protease
MKQKVFQQVGRHTKSEAVQPQTILIGLGNPILGDDGIGWRVVKEFGKKLENLRADISNPIASASIELEYLSLGGLSLMERLIGYRQAVLVDSIVTGQNPVGTVLSFEMDSLPKHSIGHLASSHDTSLGEAIEVGRRLGANLPIQIRVVAVETTISYEFSETLSQPVESAIPKAVQQVINSITEINSANHSTTQH